MTRYIEIVTMHDEEGYDAIDRWDEDTDAAMEYLAQWDYGDETDGAAEFNGGITESDPVRMAWVTRWHRSGAYLMAGDAPHGTVTLYRVEA